MNRNRVSEALILSQSQIGESNRIVTFLSSDKGIEQAMLYGGAKSRLRSLVAPFNSGKIWIYEDAQKKSAKITDFEVQKFRPSFRESLFKTWAASLCAEILIKTHAGGSQFDEAFRLANAFLDGIDFCDEFAGKRGVLRFLWRYQIFLGENPECSRCDSCGKPFFSENSIVQAEKIAFSFQNHGFFCEKCRKNLNFAAKDTFLLNPSAIFYLFAVQNFPPSKSRATKIDESDTLALKNLLCFLAEKSVGKRLNSLQLDFWK